MRLISKMVKCTCLGTSHYSSDCCTGRKSPLDQVGFSCLVWVTMFMQPVHFALIMVPHSSKVSSQPTAGSSGKSLMPLVIVCQLLNLIRSPWHGDTVFVYNKPFFGLHYSIAYFNVCTGDIGLSCSLNKTLLLTHCQRTLPHWQPFTPSKPITLATRCM
jgi:hypothetical protein